MVIRGGGTMEYKEIRHDLFDMCASGYSLAHCISADFALGAGIAKTFEARFGIKNRLVRKFGAGWHKGFSTADATCIACGPFSHGPHGGGNVMVFNLVTKKRYWEKPTLESMAKSLTVLRKQCEKYGVKKLAMPKIGCGLDRLNWKDVSELVKKTFAGSGIHIVVCYL